MYLLEHDNKPENEPDDYDDLLKQNEESLKERFGKTEDKLKIENSLVVRLTKIWNFILTTFSIIFAVIGFLSLILPRLRFCQVQLFLQFFREIGLL